MMELKEMCHQLKQSLNCAAMKIISAILLGLHLAASPNIEIPKVSSSVKMWQSKGQWETLFDGKDASKHWTSVKGGGFPTQGWKVEDGVLKLVPGQKGGDIISKKVYSDFILEMEFKLDKNTNSGVKYLVSPLQTKAGKVELNGPEYQMIDDFNHESVKGGISPKTETGSAYLLYAPNKNKVLKPHGQWNKARIVVKGNLVEHWLNGKKILSYERGTDEFRALVAGTKFEMYSSRYGEAISGHIMLTDHQDASSFRNIRIKRI